MSDEKKKGPAKATAAIDRKAHNALIGQRYVDLQHDNFLKTVVKCPECSLPLMVFKGKEPAGHPRRVMGSCFGCINDQPILVPPGEGLGSIVADAEA